ncbi:MAG: sigma-70 family RNA polymerase sigma factor [Chitinophagaceae bacterium]|nr:sigma-70 family RNA polymerase sigma factor [Chitinophagaceae bacterium]
MKMKHQPDIHYWQTFIQGDREALGWLFRQYYPDLFRYGHKIYPDPAVLEDCIQELFIELWQSKNPPPSISVKAYLLKAMKYKLLKVLRKKSNTSLQADLAENSVFQISHEDFIIGKQESEEKTAKVVQALNQLTNRQKEIVYLKFYQNLGYEEISEIMNINYQVARNLLHQAVKAMKKILLRHYSLLSFLI